MKPAESTIKASHLVDLMDQLPQLPVAMDGLLYIDIPNKFIKTADFLPFQSLNVDATAALFYQSLQVCKTTTQDSLPHWEEQVEEIFVPRGIHPDERAFVSLSVRSTFDIYLQVRQYPKGSEVVMTGINIGDMIQII